VVNVLCSFKPWTWTTGILEPLDTWRSGTRTWNLETKKYGYDPVFSWHGIVSAFTYAGAGRPQSLSSYWPWCIIDSAPLAKRPCRSSWPTSAIEPLSSSFHACVDFKRQDRCLGVLACRTVGITLKGSIMFIERTMLCSQSDPSKAVSQGPPRLAMPCIHP
jgi:hypothetical protein